MFVNLKHTPIKYKIFEAKVYECDIKTMGCRMLTEITDQLIGINLVKVSQGDCL